jgi:hypothetical protein
MSEKLDAMFGADAADYIRQLQAEIEQLRTAARAVCRFDWSGNDDDAAAAIDDLRRALEEKT